MLPRGTLVITDYGLVGHVQRCLSFEVIEVAVGCPGGRTALIDSRDLRFVRGIGTNDSPPSTPERR